MPDGKLVADGQHVGDDVGVGDSRTLVVARLGVLQLAEDILALVDGHEAVVNPGTDKPIFVLVADTGQHADIETGDVVEDLVVGNDVVDIVVRVTRVVGTVHIVAPETDAESGTQEGVEIVTRLAHGQLQTQSRQQRHLQVPSFDGAAVGHLHTVGDNEDRLILAAAADQAQAGLQIESVGQWGTPVGEIVGEECAHVETESAAFGDDVVRQTGIAATQLDTEAGELGASRQREQ